MEYEAVIGLEVHAQIHTQSKMFCGCPIKPDTGNLEPNMYVCPICLALPGTLPVVNRRAVEMGMLAGLALNCTISPINVFSRKSYFYPDLPKGYQISQYDLPLAVDGYLEVEVEGERRRIGVHRAHLEEDTGKLYHMEDGSVMVDFNRAGVPLLEIVSEPDMHSVAEVQAYATGLHEVLVYLGINSGDMEKGVMRFEANVSVRPQGQAELSTRTEIKNLNSFRALTRGVAYEIERQIAVLETGGVIQQQTMGWDESEERTYPQRSKEFAHDYRYFPEPDIPPLEIEAAWIEQVQAQVPELPLAKKRRLIATYDIRPYDAELLVSTQAIANYFETAAEQACEANIAPQEVANWITGELFRLMNENGQEITELSVAPEKLVDLIKLREAGAVSITAAKQVLSEIFETGEDPQEAMKRLGLAQISDTDALASVIQKVIAENPKQVGQYLAGKTQVIGWFIGQVMKETRGKANPQTTRELVQHELEHTRSEA
ncbi:MAG: Asp-tRNA(Asn)/Glu-tRNA(Gln) amidotransferase subunit GatB [Anaerolineales bacterium]